jgi:prolyl 4-hydroxylase
MKRSAIILLMTSVWIWLICSSFGAKDIFSSMDEMKTLFEEEESLVKILEQSLKDTETQIDVIDTYIKHGYTSETRPKLSDQEEYVSNPVNVYAMIRRLSKFWPPAMKQLQTLEQNWPKVMKKTESLTSLKDGELFSASESMVLLHETYNLNLQDFAMGKLKTPGNDQKVYESDQHLSGFDLYNFAKTAFNRKFYDLSYEFLQAAKWKSKLDHNDTDHVYISQLEKTVVKTHDQVLIQKGPIGETWRTFKRPLNPELAKIKKFQHIKKMKYSKKPVLFKGDLDDQVLREQFNALCRGDQLRHPKLDANLSCKYWYATNDDPYQRLGPFKLEILSSAPFVGKFHDFMTDTECEDFKSFGSDKLTRSTHHHKDSVFAATSLRTSKQAWIYDYGDQTNAVAEKQAHNVTATKSVSNKIDLATRLQSRSTNLGEPFQVANYGVGGVYNHHCDATSDQDHIDLNSKSPFYLSTGTRIATLMVYMSNVDAGGATVFPALGLTVWPVKGDSLFWYSIDNAGQVDLLTHHGGCPVLKGSKWITNKWIRWYNQFDSNPCGLDNNIGSRRYTLD